MHKHKLIKYFCCFTMRARVLWHVVESTRNVTAWPFLPYFEVRILRWREDCARHNGDCHEVVKADGGAARYLKEMH